MNPDPQQLREIYRRLPEQLKQAMESVETAEVVREIGKRYSLHVDQMGALAAEIGYVMLGAMHAFDFTRRLQKALGISEAQAKMIAHDADEKIFNKIRHHLMEMPARVEEVMRQETLAAIEERVPSAPQPAQPMPLKREADPYREPVE